MTTKGKSNRTKGVRQRHERLRRLGLRPEQVPDLDDPRVRANIRREARLLATHPENDDIDAWIEQMYDWTEWR